MEIPHDIFAEAYRVCAEHSGLAPEDASELVDAVARAILAERERNIKACEGQKAIFGSDEYATG